MPPRVGRNPAAAVIGVVTRWNKCYGTVAANGRLFFLHRDDAGGLDLAVGARVTFEPSEEDVRGPRATALQLIEER